MVLKILAAFIIAYIIGAIPVGWLIVKLATGKDVRSVGSGRVGGTNVMRAAGVVSGILTAALDAGKGILSGFLAVLLVPDNPWVKFAAVTFTVIGQIFSIFLIEKSNDGKLRLRGGAGGSTTLGGVIALWPGSWIIILPLIILVYLLVGYASVTTISIAFLSLVVLGYRAVTGAGPWEYAFYGLLSLIAVLYALQPNLKRLREGTERAVGLRAYFQKKFNQS